MVMNTRALDRAEAVSDTRVRTLVVDDSPFMLKILTQILEAAGDFDLVGTATNGRQALRYVSMLSPDLVLMDIPMPGLNGIQVTRSIKQSEHPPVVILTSSDHSFVTKTTAEEAGADALVSKEGNRKPRKFIGPVNNFDANMQPTRKRRDHFHWREGMGEDHQFGVGIDGPLGYFVGRISR